MHDVIITDAMDQDNVQRIMLLYCKQIVQRNVKTEWNIKEHVIEIRVILMKLLNHDNAFKQYCSKNNQKQQKQKKSRIK